MNFLILTLINFIIFNYAQTEQKIERNYLTKEFLAKDGVKTLENVEKWRHTIKLQFTKLLSEISENAKTEIIKHADKENGHNWDELKVSEFLEFKRTGDRHNYESHMGNRRQKLGRLVIGELLTGHGKYIDMIANGLWLILEESTWTLPAHLYIQKAGIGLPDPEDPIIDLGVGSTTELISWIRFLLNDQLEIYAPKNMFIKRFDYEIERRVIRPFLERGNMWWMGFGKRNVNNWNIWINTNILQMALLTINNSTVRNSVITKTIHSADEFINWYTEDGGCDEGPGYWVEAGGRLGEFIGLLSRVTNGALSWSSNQLIHNIGSYIYKVHIDGNRFVNFADCRAMLTPEPSRVYDYGEIFNDTKMMEFAAYLNGLYGTNDKTLISKSSTPPVFVEELEIRSKLKSIDGKAPYLAESWLNQLEVLTLRSKGGSPKGLFMGAKGGNNGESHNHNDVGSFILYIDGSPALIDAGVGTYTAQTFSPDRYKLWYMQSQWHNSLPTINGHMQKEGEHYKASNVSYTKNHDSGVFEMDIAGAYPIEAAVKHWKKKMIFNGTAETLEIFENYQLTQWKETFVMHYITILHDNIDKSQKGKLILKGNNNKSSLMMQYDDNMFDVNIEKKMIDDDRLSSVWGNHITRINLKFKHSGVSLTGNFSTLFKVE